MRWPRSWSRARLRPRRGWRLRARIEAREAIAHGGVGGEVHLVFPRPLAERGERGEALGVVLPQGAPQLLAVQLAAQLLKPVGEEGAHEPMMP